MTAGIRSLGTVVQYSTETYPTTAQTWLSVPEIKGVTWNPVAAARIPFSNLSSTEVEEKLGLRGKGSVDITGNFLPKDTAMGAIITLDSNKLVKWWKITYVKYDGSSTVSANEVFAGIVDVAAISPGNTEAPVEFNFTCKVQSNYTFTQES